MPPPVSRVRARSPEVDPPPRYLSVHPQVDSSNSHIKKGRLAIKHKRWVMIDTETTGLNQTNSDSIVEIAAIEVVDREATGATFHRRCKPTSPMDPVAEKCHGLSTEMLQHEPVFAKVAPHVLRFMRMTADVRSPIDIAAEVSASQNASQNDDGDLLLPEGSGDLFSASQYDDVVALVVYHLPMLVTHNARFDCGMIDAALRNHGHPTLAEQGFHKVCSMELFRAMYPGERYCNLDSCCKFFGIRGREGKSHGAMLDSEVAVQVMIKLVEILAEHSPRNSN
jgi:DNA polymerase III epsilon subunit-like protein